MEPSILSEMSWVGRVREFGQMMRIYDLLQLSLREVCFIQVLASVRHVARVQWVAAEVVLVER